MAFLFNQQKLVLMKPSTNLMVQTLEKSFVLVQFFSWILNSNAPDKIFILRKKDLDAKIVENNFDYFFKLQQLKVCSESEPSLWLHESLDARIYPFMEGDRDQLEKFREVFVGEPSNVLKRKAFVDEPF